MRKRFVIFLYASIEIALKLLERHVSGELLAKRNTVEVIEHCLVEGLGINDQTR
jgi:hypothetical protein